MCFANPFGGNGIGDKMRMQAAKFVTAANRRITAPPPPDPFATFGPRIETPLGSSEVPPGFRRNSFGVSDLRINRA